MNSLLRSIVFALFALNTLVLAGQHAAKPTESDCDEESTSVYVPPPTRVAAVAQASETPCETDTPLAQVKASPKEEPYVEVKMPKEKVEKEKEKEKEKMPEEVAAKPEEDKKAEEYVELPEEEEDMPEEDLLIPEEEPEMPEEEVAMPEEEEDVAMPEEEDVAMPEEENVAMPEEEEVEAAMPEEEEEEPEEEEMPEENLEEPETAVKEEVAMPAESSPTTTAAPSASSTPCDTDVVTYTTELSATRTISVAEASALAQEQAANPGSLPDDENTQSVFQQMQGWIDSVFSGQAEGDATESEGGEVAAGGQVPENCAETVVPEVGETCETIEGKFGLEAGSLIQANSPRIDAECFNLVAGETYCVKTA